MLPDKQKMLEVDNSAFQITSLDRYKIKPLWYDITTARLLSLIDSFYDDVRKIRASIFNKSGLDAFPYESLFGYEYDEDGLQPIHLYYYLENIIENSAISAGSDSSGLRKILDEHVDLMINKYMLTHRWRFPIEILIVSDVLILPLNSPIYISHPVVKGGVMDMVGERLEEITSRSVNPKSFLTITITEQMTISELIRHLKSSVSLANGMRKLPVPIRSKLGNNALYWGHLAWALKEFGDSGITWDGVANKLMDTKPDVDVPDIGILTEYYNRFIKSRSSFIKH